ncbi:MAG: [FeFe] hydrogenase H-cluster maturation GTPase HydF [Syntrophomonadaceae bacterium]|nr:[FeFe] hydrogenase H-cluster maturation GTPase HydF [Syntrophomonadaceae bacterium]
MNNTPRANRPHIGIFGRRNAGKSSLLNALTNQEVALVSEEAGTTTDPVYKNMELLPLGPIVLIDTAGIDDTGILGNLRMQKTSQVLDKTDLAILVIDATEDISDYELDIIGEFIKRQIPYISVLNKIDHPQRKSKTYFGNYLNISLNEVSTKTMEGIDQLKRLIIENISDSFAANTIVGDLLEAGDTCVLVTPIDSGAPRGRLILPQVQTLRDILDNNAMALVTKETNLKTSIGALAKPPKLVITDSQAFAEVDKILPSDIPLTSFSILFARNKGDLATIVTGINAIKTLQAYDKVLIAEICTHHKVAEDIASVKIPNILRKLESKIDISWCSGTAYPDNIEDYKLIIHCGACMINRKQMLSRIKKATEKGVPITNYGVFLAYATGILDRAIKPFNLQFDEI